MTAPTQADLVRRLFAELDRGADADLGEILAALGVLEEPPEFLDAEILAEIPGAAAPGEVHAEAPPPEIDRAILAAAETALRERAPVVDLAAARRRRLRPATLFAAVAVAAGLVLAFGLGRLTRRDAAVSDAVESAELDLALRVCAAPGHDWRAWPTPGPDSPPLVRPTSADRDVADPDRFAQALIDFSARVRARSDGRLARELEETLRQGRSRCPARSRCFGALSLRMGELALEDHRPDDALAAAAEAAGTSDPEVVSRARALEDEARRARDQR